MSFRLRSYEAPLPGGYCWQEGSFKPPCQPVIEAMARIVSERRKAMGQPRSSIQESLKDVDCYQCQRLGNNPTYCTDTNPGAVALASNAPIIAPPCQGCGAKVQ